jgi:UDP-N-acetyl-D-galactosamine dehydrogenase
MGATFKENVSDIRNSKVADVVKELRSFMVDVAIADPFAESDELKHEYGFELSEITPKSYDAVIVAVNHDEYVKMSEADFKGLMKDDEGILVDVKGIFRNDIKDLQYWSL